MMTNVQLKQIRNAILIFLTLTSFLFPEKKIVENIKVEEWIVPIYAVDARGDSVTDLNNNEIELYINDIKISKFNFIKKQFFTGEKKDSKWFRTKNEEKLIILVFDTSLTKAHAIMKSKAIADQLVGKSGDDTKFILFKIKGFHGLSYLGGPTNDKTRIRAIIKKRILPRDNKRSVSSGVDDSEGEKTKYQHDERIFFLIEQSRFLNHKSSQFSSSFQSLYYAIKNLTGTKFIYLFSEGISIASYRGGGGGHAGKMAGSLLKSGAVLFFINPSGGRGIHPESGEGFLRVLSSLSGGKYLTGDTKSITNKIENVHKAYYELTFQSPDDLKGGMLRIDIRSKRKNVNIHTIRNLEKSKGYLGLNNFEKKLLVLNMISKNHIFKSPVEVEDAKIEKEEKKRSGMNYTVSIPEHFRNTNLDLYKIQMPSTNAKPVIKKSVIKTSKKAIKINFLHKEGYSPHFALINYNMNLALIKGVEKNIIRIESASYRNRVLEFELKGFAQKKIKEKDVALLRITIKIIDMEGKEIQSDSKEITVLKKLTKLRIPLRKINPGNYNVLIAAKDMILGDNVNKVIEAKVK